MPDFTFSGPDGKSITITGPEGATRDQAIDILRQQHPELWEQKPDVTGSPFSQTVVGAGKGFIRGAEEAIDKGASFLPWSETYQHGIPTIPPSTSTAGKFGRFAGNIAPSFALSGLGLPGISGKVIEGAIQGGIGGAMQPGDTRHNTALGMLTGGLTKGALGGLGVAGTAAFNKLQSLPPSVRGTLNSLAAAATLAQLHGLGIPFWYTWPLFTPLYRAKLVDLATQWAGRLATTASEKIPAGPIGAGAAHIKGDSDEQQR